MYISSGVIRTAADNIMFTTTAWRRNETGPTPDTILLSPIKGQGCAMWNPMLDHWETRIGQDGGVGNCVDRIDSNIQTEIFNKRPLC